MFKQIPSGQKVSKFFQAESGGDVVFRSSDNVLFYVQQKYLELYSEGFPLTEQVTLSQEIVPLTESSSVLELLFQFTYPHMPPDLDDLDFRSLMNLAEAAEKYFIHYCRKICVIHMKSFISQHRDEIFAFAAKYDHVKLFCHLAPTLVWKPLSEMVDLLPPSLYIPWSLYHDQWSSLMLRYLQNPGSCSSSSRYISSSVHGDRFVSIVHNEEWLRKLKALTVDAFEINPEKIHQWNECETCRDCRGWIEWKARFQNDVRKLKDLKAFVEEYKEKASRS
ncbi:hypothetical protein K435DRAFT_974063 [Dendrothele bispora CBS 962.96]|uniref:BTB domain-containing protein n=1 Tax=Dendrothele bispora (strain CBS 962.96) TaxID=1314807 RepID=A0A4S8KNQ3_DENBC|nr:hypothetical protein K435DRAFT_974063 [Dendrothele bispora CBS 962.96]